MKRGKAGEGSWGVESQGTEAVLSEGSREHRELSRGVVLLLTNLEDGL